MKTKKSRPPKKLAASLKGTSRKLADRMKEVGLGGIPEEAKPPEEALMQAISEHSIEWDSPPSAQDRSRSAIEAGINDETPETQRGFTKTAARPTLFKLFGDFKTSANEAGLEDCICS